MIAFLKLMMEYTVLYKQESRVYLSLVAHMQFPGSLTLRKMLVYAQILAFITAQWVWEKNNQLSTPTPKAPTRTKSVSLSFALTY